MAILLPVVLGFASGVLLRSFFVFGLPYSFFLILIGFVVLIAWHVKRRSTYLIAGIFLIAAALGIVRFHSADAPLPEAFLPDLETRITYEGRVVAEPDVRDASQRITIDVEKDGSQTRVLAVSDRYPPVSYGDTVRAEGELTLPEPFDTDGGRVFRYDKFLEKDGVQYVISFAELEVVEPYKGYGLRSQLYDLKRSFNEALGRALPEPHASLASGLILGGKQGLGKELQEDFTIAGLIHVVVLSGYNVMIVAIAVMRLLSFLPRRYGAGAAGVVIGLFVLMAGAGAASVRAGTMACLGLFARATARTFDALRALLVAGFVMVLWNPHVLAFDPGFQLSLIATLGLILGAPFVAARLAFIKNGFLREIAASTISAQIAVLPLLLYQTGLFSTVALPVNLLVLPIVPLAMALSFFAGAFALLIPPLSVIGGLPAYGVLTYIIEATEFAAALPVASFSLPAFPFVLILAAYAVLGYLVFRLMKGLPAKAGASLQHSN